jgi:hypothetical protein
MDLHFRMARASASPFERDTKLSGVQLTRLHGGWERGQSFNHAAIS